MRRIATLAVIALLALPAAAFAASGSSTCQAYNPETCGPTQISRTTPTQSGTLPFTGLDVVLLVVGGGTLLGAGFVVRRVSRRLD
jgi:hypothetical protein